MDERWQRLGDECAIRDGLARYWRGIDRRDPGLVLAAYHSDAWDDHGSYAGDVEGFLAFVASEVHARFRTTMHKLGQSLIEIEGDVARAESYAICHHVHAEADPADVAPGGAAGSRSEAPAGDAFGGERESPPGPAVRDVADLVMGIRSIDRFERRAGQWRIARRELRWEWVRNGRLEALDPGWTSGRSDAGDPVYA